MNSNRIESLDSLRGIAALSVVNFHILVSFVILHKANYYQEYENSFIRFIVESPFKLVWGGIGVLLFFVLSGYVLTNLFSKPGKLNYLEYISKRFIRIYVPYIVAMAISLALIMIFLDFKSSEIMSPTHEKRWDHFPSIKAVIAYILMLQVDTANVNGVVWTLYHEMRISIIFPIIAFIVLKLKFKQSIIGALIFCFGTVGVLNLVNDFISINLLSLLIKMASETFFYTFFFFIGAYLCRYRQTIMAFTKNKSKLFIFAIFMTGLLLIANRWMYNFVDIGKFNAQDIIAGIGVFLFFVAIMSSSSAEKFLSHKVFKWLGDKSFSIYLTHIPVIMVTTSLLSPLIGMWQSMLCSFVLIFPTAYLFNKVIIVPSIGWSKSFSSYITKAKDKKKVATKVESA